MPTVGPDPCYKMHADFAEAIAAAVAEEDWEEVARLSAAEATNATKTRAMADLQEELWG